MKVHVRHKHIEHGDVCDCAKCPVALAIGAAIECDNVHVFPDWIFVWNNGTEHAMRTPRTVREFVKAFDSGKPVMPFEFNLLLEQA